MVDFEPPSSEHEWRTLRDAKYSELESVRAAARQVDLARGSQRRPRLGLLRRAVRFIRGGGD